MSTTKPWKPWQINHFCPGKKKKITLNVHPHIKPWTSWWFGNYRGQLNTVIHLKTTGGWPFVEMHPPPPLPPITGACVCACVRLWRTFDECVLGKCASKSVCWELPRPCNPVGGGRDTSSMWFLGATFPLADGCLGRASLCVRQRHAVVYGTRRQRAVPFKQHVTCCVQWAGWTVWWMSSEMCICVNISKELTRRQRVK